MPKTLVKDSNHPITEAAVDDELENSTLITPEQPQQTDTTLALLEKISGDPDLKKKLDQILTMLASMKE